MTYRRSSIAGVAFGMLATVLSWSGAAQAKNDIRGIAIGMPLKDASETAELDGGDCQAPAAASVNCTYGTYGAKAHISISYEATGKQPVVRALEYDFVSSDLAKTRNWIRTLYQTRGQTFHDEFKLPTGEQLKTTFGDDGRVTLTISKDDPAAATRTKIDH